MSHERIELRMPDLDLPGTNVTVSSWYAAAGSRVVEGDRLLEVLAGEVTVDLAAPASGTLVERCVDIDEQLHINQLLAVIEVA
jgi:pyruvate/2-oxoglutarate dehydrogenase complex dihydrolipoamide acyltransferase (E2) component